MNNISFGSLKISNNNATREAFKAYTDCLNTARVMNNSFKKVNELTGGIPVEIKGNIIKTTEGDVINLSSYKAKDLLPLAELKIMENDFSTSRARLFGKFCNEIIENAKKIVK